MLHSLPSSKIEFLRRCCPEVFNCPGTLPELLRNVYFRLRNTTWEWGTDGRTKNSGACNKLVVKCFKLREKECISVTEIWSLWWWLRRWIEGMGMLEEGWIDCYRYQLDGNTNDWRKFSALGFGIWIDSLIIYHNKYKNRRLSTLHMKVEMILECTFGRITNIRFGDQEISCSFTSISLMNHSFSYISNQSLIYLRVHLHICVLSSFSCAWLFATPWIIARNVPLSMEFSPQEYWSELSCPPPGDLPDSGIIHRSPALQADSLPSKLSRKPIYLPTCPLAIIYLFTVGNCL